MISNWTPRITIRGRGVTEFDSLAGVRTYGGRGNGSVAWMIQRSVWVVEYNGGGGGAAAAAAAGMNAAECKWLVGWLDDANEVGLQMRRMKFGHEDNDAE
jgi:hypothetical protein